jgi:hypothetical protein
VTTTDVDEATEEEVGVALPVLEATMALVEIVTPYTSALFTSYVEKDRESKKKTYNSGTSLLREQLTDFYFCRITCFPACLLVSSHSIYTLSDDLEGIMCDLEEERR